MKNTVIMIEYMSAMKKPRFLFLFVALIFLILAYPLMTPAYANDNGDFDLTQLKAQMGQQIVDENGALILAYNVMDSSAQDAGLPAPPVIQPYHANIVASRAVERNLGLFSSRIKDKFSLWLSRSGQYLDLMKDILRQKDLPEDIVFLSLIESGFNPNAYSVARAAGPWQFIASTARRYGLEIDWWRDERRDPIKSTHAAADYLKDLYGMFGSWNLAMAAYNAGEGKILRAVKKTKSDDYWDLLKTKHIKSETKDYVPKFIAASIIASNPQDFGFGDIEYHEPMSFDEVELEFPIDLEVAAECAGTDLDVIRKLNPELRRWCTPPDMPQYVLRIPRGSRDEFMTKLMSLSEEERFTIERYTVKKGDTFQKISKMAGVPVPAILSLNAMEKIIPLTAGSKIYIPPKGLFKLDAEDKARPRKASYKQKKKKSYSRKSPKNGRKI